MDLAARVAALHLPWKGRDTAVQPDLTPQFQDFERHFDDLVDLLCWSAKDGDHEGRDEQYSLLRAWFLSHFEAVRPMLLRHIDAEPEDTASLGAGRPFPRDVFESLFLPRSVDVTINSSSVIDRISRARMAVESCRLELLARRI